MSDVRSDLAAAAAAVRPRPRSGVRAVLETLHREPEISAQVNIETQVLPPALVRGDGGWTLVGLLTESSPGSGVVHPPWGAIRWQWPSGGFLGIERWADRPAGAVGWHGDWPAPASGEYAAVLDAVDAAGPEPGERAISELFDRLREAVPAPGLGFYRSLGSIAGEPSRPADPDPESVKAWAREASGLAASYGLEPLRRRLDQLRAERSRGSFRASVVGEFNRGKSTLVNSLLRRDLLPTGPVPVTRSNVVVRAGDDEVVDIGWPGGRIEKRPLDADAFTGLTLDHDPSAVVVGEGEAGPDEPRVSVTVDDDWLRSLDLELIDTPGTNESRVDRVLQVRRAVVLSDLVVLAVSALSPLSMVERELLRDEVIGRHVTHVVVVLTMLDLVDPDEREEAVAALHARVSALSPRALVLHGPKAGDELRAAITQRAGLERASDRNRRWAVQVADVCDVLAQVARDAIDRRALDTDARAAAAAAAEAELRRTATTWEQLRLDLDGCRLRLMEAVTGAVTKRAAELTDQLFLELERSSDPRTWWQRDLPRRLRKELEGINAGLEGMAAKAVANDLVWLQKRAAHELGARVSRTTSEVRMPAPAPVTDGEVEDQTRKRRLTRLAGPAATVVALLAANVAGTGLPLVWTTIAGTGAAVLGEQRVSELTDRQRDEVRRLLHRAVVESFRGFELDADRTVAAVYAQLLDSLRADQRAWQEARLAAIAHERHGAAGPDWDALLTAADGLARTIRTGVDSTGGAR